jgi:3-oxoacyl-[acyl-carrier protein] reductase
MARETASFGINVNAICPGLIDTPMIRAKTHEDRLRYFLSQIPMGRLGTSEEEADLVLFLASEQAKYITGATIDLNGGSLMM